MLRSYLKIALRNLLKHKGYTLINLLGLAIGIACCVLIFLYVQDELRYDRFHEKGDRIYRVINHNHREATGEVLDMAITPPGLAPALRREFPEVAEAVRLFDLGRVLMAHDERRFVEENFYAADSGFFNVFSVRLLSGAPETALTEPNTLVISDVLARKYFGTDDPLGQTLTLGGTSEFTVTGVFESLPEQSHFEIDALTSFSILKSFVSEERLENWVWQQFYTYVLLPEGYDPALLEAKLPAFIDRLADPQTAGLQFHYDFSLQPLADIYLHSAHLQFDVWDRGNIAYVYAFSAVAVFILLIACFNFMNLATARSMQRAREVGMRKVIGARRSQLVVQFLGESVLLAFVALLLAFVFIEMTLPAFNGFTGKSMALDYTRRAGWIAGLLGLGLLVGLLAGSYPALFLSAFKPVQVLKGNSNRDGSNLTTLRRVLVVAQFAISIVLVISTAVVFGQLRYVQNKNLGFEKEQVVVLPFRGEMGSNFEAMKTEILRSPHVVSAAGSWGVPGGIVAGDGIRLPGSDAETPINMFAVDFDYLSTYGMEIAEGRAFSRAFPSDEHEAYILNERAARMLGWTPEEAIGKEIEWNKWGQEGEGPDPVKEGRVIGIVKDFHFRALHQEIEPLVLHIFPAAFGNISIRIRPENVPAALGHLERVWQTWAPDWPFEYSFLDQDFEAMYDSEQRVAQIFTVFSALAMFIGCLGLFGLASYTAERRTKEIGVRKVMGASTGSIVALLSSDFLKLVLIAAAIASPIAYFAMNRWLEDFAYRIEIGPGVFLLAGAAALLIALATVSYQAVKAALADPVKSLRYE